MWEDIVNKAYQWVKPKAEKVVKGIREVFTREEPEKENDRNS